MNDPFPVKYVTLGVDTKYSFKVFDILCDPEKQPLNKDLWSKPNAKPVTYDVLDYFKSKSIKFNDPYEIDKQNLTLNTDSPNTDDNKKISKKCRQRKMLQISDSLKDYKVFQIKYFATTKSGITPKTKLQQVPMWFGKRKYCSEEKKKIQIIADVKRVKLELIMESEIIYISPYSFYQSNNTLTIDTKKMIFCLFIQGWNKVELAVNLIKNLTVYTQQSFIKISLKSSILGELKHISDNIQLTPSIPLKLNPRKASTFKDGIIIFTKNPISTNDLSILKAIFGDEKVVFNTSDKENKELLTNLFDCSPKLQDYLSKNPCLSWSVLTKDLKPIITDSCHAMKASYLTPKSSPVPNIKTSNNLVRMASPVSQQVPNLILHQTPNVNINNCPKPVLNTVLCPQNQGYLTNHIVIATNITQNRLDPYPNLFNRLNDSSSIGHLASHISNMQCQPLPQNNFAFSLSSQNNGLQINNYGPIFQRPPPNNNHSNVNNGTTSSTNNGNDRNLPRTTLDYCPGYDANSIFRSFNYAPSPEYNVLIHGSDLACLNHGQYLNDNIINFYLNYVRYEKIDEEQRKRSHLFNVFFNTKLQGTSGIVLNEAPEIRHSRVAKWTKKVDIFDKDFIVIPINEAQHWFLAIICFPWMAGMISYDTLFGVTNHQPTSEIPVNRSEFATKTRLERVKRLQRDKKIDPKPCILLFDSLQHQTRAPNVKLLREYLKLEWDAKRRATDGPLVFDKNTIRGFNPQVPQQSNTIDCGIYVLHYVEMFFAHPLSTYTKEYFQTCLTQWFDVSTVEMKRESIQKLLLSKGQAQQQSDKKDASSDSLLSPKMGHDDSGPDLQIL